MYLLSAVLKDTWDVQESTYTSIILSFLYSVGNNIGWFLHLVALRGPYNDDDYLN